MRKPKMYKEQSWVCRACFAEEDGRVIQVARNEICRTKRPVVTGDVWVVGVEPDRFFDLRDRRVRLTQPHQRQAKLLIGAGIGRGLSRLEARSVSRLIGLEFGGAHP
jgi:hypothetical protein